MTVRPAWLHLFLDVPEASWDAARAFWVAALGGTLSTSRGETDQFCTVLPGEGDSWVKLQRVDAGGGVHLDLDSDDPDALRRRALDLGATPAWRYADVEVVRSPGGLALCCTRGRRGVLARNATSVLDQVSIDIPACHWDAEQAFWVALTGREPRASTRYAEFVNLPDADPAGPLRLLLHRLGEEAGVVRAHPDFAVADRRGEVARHLAWGADLVAEHEHWTVLSAPGGQAYCLTERDPVTG